MEEDNVKELPIQDGVYSELVATTNIPEFTDEDADNREFESTPKEEEGK